jgi:integrase/recombinase XerD
LAYAEQQKLKGLAPSTIRMRERVLRRFAAWLGRPLRSARVADLRAFVASRRPGLAKASQVTEINYLQAFYAALHELGLVENNPAEGLKSWRTGSPRRPISLLCVRALLLEASRPQGKPSPQTPQREALALRDRACLELLFATGMRASEVCASRAVDLDLEDASILVRRAKRGPAQRLPLPGPTLEALRRYLAHGRALLRGDESDTGSLFLAREGGSLERGTLYALVKRVAKRAGVAACPHVFRRTLTTELARSGVSLPVIQKVLGHAHLSTTGDYVAVALEDMRVALDELARQLPGSQTQVSPWNLQCRLFSARQSSAA